MSRFTRRPKGFDEKAARSAIQDMGSSASPQQFDLLTRQARAFAPEARRIARERCENCGGPQWTTKYGRKKPLVVKPIISLAQSLAWPERFNHTLNALVLCDPCAAIFTEYSPAVKRKIARAKLAFEAYRTLDLIPDDKQAPGNGK